MNFASAAGKLIAPTVRGGSLLVVRFLLQDLSAAAPRQSRLTLTVAEPAGGLLGVVSEDYGGAGALDAGQDL